MKAEIERKYVVDPELLMCSRDYVTFDGSGKPSGGVLIAQTYLSPQARASDPEVRVRTEQRYVDGLCDGSIGIKLGTGLERLEINAILAADDAERIIAHMQRVNDDRRSILVPAQEIIRKVRLSTALPQGNLILEVDIYGGSNTGLVVAEIELPDAQCQVERCNLPEYVRGEVTGNNIYSNRALAAHPFREWSLSNREHHQYNLKRCE